MPLTTSEPVETTPNDAEDVTSHVQPNPGPELARSLDAEIDKFVHELKNRLMSLNTSKRGVWDRMKGWWSNMWRGRDNKNNPEYWRNKLGDDLGVQAQESVLPMGLKEFRVLKQLAAELESELDQINEEQAPLPQGTENLRIMSVIDNWANRFKKSVQTLVGDRLSVDPSAMPTQPDAAQLGQEDQPEELGQADNQKNDLTNHAGTPEPENPEELAKTNAVSHPDDQVQNQPDEEDLSTAGEEDAVAPTEPSGSEELSYGAEEVGEGDEYFELGSKKISKKGLRIHQLKAMAEWKGMKQEQRDALDAAGGGVWKRRGRSRSGIQYGSFLEKNNVHTIPYVLTKSDPRYWILMGIRGRSVFRSMVRHNQIDGLAIQSTAMKDGKTHEQIIDAPSFEGDTQAMLDRVKGISDARTTTSDKASSRVKGSHVTRRARKNIKDGDVEAAAGAISEPISEPEPSISTKSDAPSITEPGQDDVTDTAPVSEPPDDDDMDPDISKALAKLDPKKHKDVFDFVDQIGKLADGSNSENKEIIMSVIQDAIDGESDGEDEFADSDVDRMFDSYEPLAKKLSGMPLNERNEFLKGLLNKDDKRLLPNRRKMRAMSWEERVDYLKELKQ
jgi:hypothetical protein